ncbi:MAG: AAA family ATPase, partial [Bacteroidota bacterium]
MGGAHQFFIPAGRSFFSTLQANIFALLREESQIDPFLTEFGYTYDMFKRTINGENSGLSLFSLSQHPKKGSEEILDLFKTILNGSYYRDKDKDFIILNDSRKISTQFASSGQQELLPLSLIIRGLTTHDFDGGRIVLYVEEPEAHLFPAAQKKMVEVFATLFNTPMRKIQLIITTHSPYILSAFNNLIEAGNLVQDQKGVEKVIPASRHLTFEEITAYSLSESGAQSLMDGDARLIHAETLDQVSNDIAEEFEQLLSIEE